MLFRKPTEHGKTTVARIIAKEFYNNKIIKKNKVIEVLPNDLMDEYVGWTRRKTRDILEKAKDGILFIDEAYQIASTGYSKRQPIYERGINRTLKIYGKPR